MTQGELVVDSSEAKAHPQTESESQQLTCRRETCFFSNTGWREKASHSKSSDPETQNADLPDIPAEPAEC